MSKLKISLGRGLGAILEEVEQEYQNDLSSNSDKVKLLKIDEIRPNPFQPRKTFDEAALKELSSSIKSHGLLQPIVVYFDGGKYTLIAGERRLRASKMAGFNEIKAVVADIEPKKLRELALIENIQREDLNPLELAHSYRELIDEYKITHEELAKIVFKSRVQITNTLRLLTLSEEAKNAISDERISQGHAKILVGLDEKEQKLALDSIIGQKLSVRDTESLVKKIKEGSKTTIKKSNIVKMETEIEVSVRRLSEIFSKEGFSSKAVGAKLTLEFKEKSDLEFFMKKILKDGFIKSNL